MGLSWLLRFTGTETVLAAGFYPFLVGDAVKALAAALLLPGAWKLLGSGPGLNEK
jgi:biotin transport system substrate-specific component